MKNLRYYLNKAQSEKWSLGQFNFSTAEQFYGIVHAAVKLKSPVILGTSEGESKFFGLEEAVALRNVLRKKAGLPIFLNLDHGKSFDYLRQAIDSGYDMVHFDGSKLPLEENIKISKQVKSYAGWRGVLVEGEVGVIANDASKIYEEKFEIQENLLTNPDESVKYISKSKVDLLAVSVGNFHGMGTSGESPHLKLGRLAEIKNKIGKMLLVLHGGSGTPEIDIKEAIKLGVAKINVNTELRLAYTNSLKKALAENPAEIAPYKYLSETAEAVQKVVEGKIILFQSNSKI